MLTDSVWLAVAISGAVSYQILGINDWRYLIAFWIAGGWLSGIVGALLVKRLFGVLLAPRSLFPQATSWARRNGRFGLGLSFDFLLGGGLGQIIVLFLGGAVGVSEVASVRGAQLLLAPLNIVIAGGMPGFLARKPAASVESKRRLISYGLKVGTLFSIASLVWLIVILLLPSSIGRLLLGDTWPGARICGAILGAGMLAYGFAQGAGLSARMMRRSFPLLVCRAVVAVVLVILTLVIAVPYGATGISYVMAVANFLLAALFWAAVTTLRPPKHSRLTTGEGQ